jgi:hypothetical protein
MVVKAAIIELPVNIHSPTTLQTISKNGMIVNGKRVKRLT